MAKKTRHGKSSSRSADKKHVPLNIRVSEAEKLAFVSAAEIAGVPLSAWMRERLRKTARIELEAANRSVPFIKPVMPE